MSSSSEDDGPQSELSTLYEPSDAVAHIIFVPSFNSFDVSKPEPRERRMSNSHRNWLKHYIPLSLPYCRVSLFSYSIQITRDQQLDLDEPAFDLLQCLILSGELYFLPRLIRKKSILLLDYLLFA